MSCSELANVLSGVAFILRTSSGPAFPVDHTAIDTAHPKVVDRNNQASDGRMTVFCGTPRFCSPDERLLSAPLGVALHLRCGTTDASRPTGATIWALSRNFLLPQAPGATSMEP